MQTLEGYAFKHGKRSFRKPVCQVVICTIASCKVRRIKFASWDAARRYADDWMGKNVDGPAYRVSVEQLS